MLENRRLELEQQVAVVKMSGNEAGIARAEYEQKLSLLNMETNLERAKTEDETIVKMIDERHARKVSLLMMERDLTLKNLDEVAKKEAEQNQKLADDAARRDREQAEAEQKRIKREAEEASRLRMQEVRANEDRIKEIADLEQQRVSSQQAGIGSAQTALGSFKFDAYPAADKRKNDERLVGLMTNIRDQQRAAGFI
jgi:hypothetical protein